MEKCILCLHRRWIEPLEGWNTGILTFKAQFGIDEKVHSIVKVCESTRPSYGEQTRCVKGIDPKNVILFALSLLIRCPTSRERFERLPGELNIPKSDGLAAPNVEGFYHAAKRLVDRDLSNFTLGIAHSTGVNFTVGDGYFDALTDSVLGNAISGFAAVPLTPRICLILRGNPRFIEGATIPKQMKPRVRSFLLDDWLVDEINKVTQIASRDRLFFWGSVPKITSAYRVREFGDCRTGWGVRSRDPRKPDHLAPPHGQVLALISHS